MFRKNGVKSGKRVDEEHPVIVYYRYQSLGEFKGSRRLQGPFRVIVFCLLAILSPTLLLITPLYVRYEHYKDVTYTLGESDLITVDRPISTFWCSGQELWMNATFNAFLLDKQPQISEDFKHIEMKKHLQLADDTLEYWGFFLLQGSKVTLSVCSRYDGARLMVVKGAKNLKSCALIETSKDKDHLDPWEEDVSAPQGEKIEVIFQQEEAAIEKSPNEASKFGLSNHTYYPIFSDFHSINNSSKGHRSSNKKFHNLDRNQTYGRRRNRKNQFNASRINPSRKSLKAINSIQTELTSMTSQSNETFNDEKRSQKHLSSFDQKRILRKRFITTEAEEFHYDEYDQILPVASNEENDLPPPPVGIEPKYLKVENHAESESIDEEDIRSSGSSFAKNLWSCYGGDTLFTQTFSASVKCTSQESMMTFSRMKMVHEVTSTGYYYYIFYSDNDIISNDIFARFNIEKVQYSYPNYTRACRNTTQCSFPFGFLSSEKVLIEVPIQDGVSDEDALAQMILISTCLPRIGIYLVFPIATLLCILCCSFM